MRIAICDDQEASRNALLAALTVFKNSHTFVDQTEQVKVEVYCSASELLESDIKFDILFLDISLGDADGISTGIRLRDMGYSGVIIIQTSFIDRTMDAFQVTVLRYLVKPIQQNKFDEALQAALNLLHTSQNSIVIRFNGKDQFIKISDIIYLESYYKKITLVTINGEVETTSLWKELTKQLPARHFEFIQKSYLINFHQIEEKLANTVILSNKKKLNISVRYRQRFEVAYNRYLEGLAWGSQHLHS